MSTAITTAPFRFFDAEVARRTRLGPTMTRITFSGPHLRLFAGGGRDQSFSLFLPHPLQSAPVLPTGPDWFGEWRAMDPDVRAVMRSYTIRDQRPELGEVDVDFALHGDQGPASRWAGRACPGDRVVLLGPTAAENKSVSFRPTPGTDSVILAADETALPALGGILAWLPAGVRVRAWVEVPHPSDVQELPTRADAEIEWLIRSEAPAHGESPALTALRSAALPGLRPYAWLAGESGTVRALRRHLVGERGFDRRDVTFTGYWRRGASEEDLRAQALAGAGASA